MLLPPSEGLLGSVVRARILSASRWSVLGEVLPQGETPAIAVPQLSPDSPQTVASPEVSDASAANAGGLQTAPALLMERGGRVAASNAREQQRPQRSLGGLSQGAPLAKASGEWAASAGSGAAWGATLTAARAAL